MRSATLLTAIFILSYQFSYSQLLQGRVLNEFGGSATDVNVEFQNKLNRISTDREGRFRILATKLPDTLVFSATGYEPYKVVITEKNIKDINFEVVLLNSRATMDEVVVTAMGSGRKNKELSYSVASPRPLYTTGTSPVKPGKEISKTGLTRAATETSSRLFFKDTSLPSREGILAKSRILTAGEINDFTKWKMWQDYSATDFKLYSRQWNFFTSGRYSVQVTDKKYNAVINEPVFLISKKTKDTVWKAYTDNTGRAELWGSMFDSTGSGDYFILAKDEKNNNPVEFSNGVNHIQLNTSCNFSKEVDIAFVVDATGSMGDEIEFLKLELEDVIAQTMEKYKSLSLRMASVFYRDNDDIYITKHVDFNDDLLKTMNFIKLQQAGGGGDYPEAVDEALITALDSLKWNPSARMRLMFLVMDAPAHYSAKKKIETLIAKAAAMGIHIIPLACSGTEKTTEFLMRSIALATNGTYAFLTDHSGVGNKHIEPTTDKYSVELLNNLMQRIIAQYLYAKDCESTGVGQEPVFDQPGNLLKVKIYPNPTNGRFIVEANKPIKEMYVADFSGKILQRLKNPSGKGNKQRWDVDISAYASGTYLVKYITEENKWGSEKVILVH